MTQVDADHVLNLLEEHDSFVQVHRGVILLLGIRNALVLEWLRYRARGGWLNLTLEQLGDEIGLSLDQMKRAMPELVEAGVVVWEEPDRMSRKRRYRIATRETRPVESAESHRPESAESHPPPIEGERKIPPTPHDNSQGPPPSFMGRKVLEVILREARKQQTGSITNPKAWEDAVRGNWWGEHGADVERLAAKYPDAPADVIAGAAQGESSALRLYQSEDDGLAAALAHMAPEARAAYEDDAG